ncbi:MAG: hypothetical protein PF508_22235, partial [Spirochaeta sp.]|nr:hypothetical protein [Spirochaeta sp.]
PVVDADRAWKREHAGAPQIFCTGGLAELELGPPARNIIGAHLAGRRIIPALREQFTARKSR